MANNCQREPAALLVVFLGWLLAGCPGDEPTAGRGREVIHIRTYPVAAFRTESHDRLIFRSPPEGRWLDLPQGHVPVFGAQHDYDIAILVDRPEGAVVRGAFGFAGRPEEPGEATTATFRIRWISPEAKTDGKLLETTVTFQGEASFEDFELTVPGGEPDPVYLGFEVRYRRPASEAKRRPALWVDPVLEEREPVTARLPPGAPSVLLVTADTTRQDALGIYGGAAPTPSLDALAADGMVFDNGFSVAFGTAPSHASLFTSLPAAHHGIYDNQSILSQDHVTLAEVLHDRGYATAAFISGVPIARALGLTQGFDLYDDLMGLDPCSGLGEFSKHERRADVTIDRFMSWLDEQAAEPFFAWLHFYDPHQPYAPPPSTTPRARPALRAYFETPEGAPKHLRLPAALRARPDRLKRVQHLARERYHAEISFMDAQIGRVVERLVEKGLYDGMILAFVADHGENLAEREFPMTFEHQGLFAGVARLPFLLKLPGSQHAGSRRDHLFGNLDVAPTLLDLAGIETPPQWTGRSFRRLLVEGGRDFRPHLVLEGANRQEISVRTRKWMYRTMLGDFRSQAEKLRFLGYRPGRPDEVYDLGADPGETRKLDPENVATFDSLDAILRAFLATEQARGETLDSPEHREALEALGYVQD